jgi:hypothetical protein
VPAHRFFAARFSARFSHSGSVFSLCVLPRCSGLQITASDGPWLSPLQKIGVVPDALLLPSFGPKQIESTDADENGSRVYLFRNPATARKMDAIGLCPDTGPETRETGGQYRIENCPNDRGEVDHVSVSCKKPHPRDDTAALTPRAAPADQRDHDHVRHRRFLNEIELDRLASAPGLHLSAIALNLFGTVRLSAHRDVPVRNLGDLIHARNVPGRLEKARRSSFLTALVLSFRPLAFPTNANR